MILLSVTTGGHSAAEPQLKLTDRKIRDRKISQENGKNAGRNERGRVMENWLYRRDAKSAEKRRERAEPQLVLGRTCVASLISA